jgi:hypothetical protein
LNHWVVDYLVGLKSADAVGWPDALALVERGSRNVAMQGIEQARNPYNMRKQVTKHASDGPKPPERPTASTPPQQGNVLVAYSPPKPNETPPMAVCVNQPTEAHTKTPNQELLLSERPLLVECANCAGGEQ